MAIMPNWRRNVVVVGAIATIAIAAGTALHADGAKPKYELCAPRAGVSQTTVNHVNATQRKYQIPPNGKSLASRTMADGAISSVHVLFVPGYCGYLEGLGLSANPHHPQDLRIPDPYQTDNVTTTYRGRPITSDKVCISNDMPKWSKNINGTFHIMVTCDRLYATSAPSSRNAPPVFNV